MMNTVALQKCNQPFDKFNTSIKIIFKKWGKKLQMFSPHNICKVVYLLNYLYVIEEELQIIINRKKIDFRVELMQCELLKFNANKCMQSVQRAPSVLISYLHVNFANIFNPLRAILIASSVLNKQISTEIFQLTLARNNCFV
ncbi:hypothetical protein T4B_13724 [Trichinella pseudospiralis]|uniref:Uncharacterized protein n=1 Tax=Trichinella pseudospiralis TaxID=6337 RepID=A0A0V1J1B6_TRIPS|nr:hypothetical protein T4B_13511 [Trichinella pseudospiralis]KRZ28754.1 hypothetical protein T4B_13724 [Trichinella pseudospiralis]KRZ30544.1 hypothetical protein T4C_9097 [Trichinella pseudospiralis]